MKCEIEALQSAPNSVPDLEGPLGGRAASPEGGGCHLAGIRKAWRCRQVISHQTVASIRMRRNI